MRGLSRAQSTITTVSKPFSTNPFHNLKTYNPFEKKQGSNNERKESEEIEHDQPILENLLKRANSSPGFSNPENMVADPRSSSHCNSCGDHPEVSLNFEFLLLKSKNRTQEN